MSAQPTIGWRSLRHVCPNLTPARAQELARILGPAMVLADATTRPRAEALIAQWAHESDCFRTRQEYATGAAYEGRRDLGNSRRGDGRRFKGGGFIQTTGRVNYRHATAAVRRAWARIRRAFPATRRRRAAPDFEGHPELVRGFDTWAAVTSALWWRDHGCNQLADQRAFVALTRRINGGTNGLRHRQQLYGRARRVGRYLVPKER